MKNFFTSLLGSLAALCIFAFCAFLIVVGIIGALVSVGARKNAAAQKVEPGSYLVFDLATNITDAPPGFELGSLGDDHKGPLQLREVTRALRVAARDDRIAGVLVVGSLQPQGLGSGYGALREVRMALSEFRRSHKPVKAYLDAADTRDYYVATAADEVTLDPYGVIFMPGLATEPMFFAGAEEKYGVDVQVTRVGKYKSFVEPFTRTDMSPEAREETQRLLDDVWGSLLSDIGRSRGLPASAIQATVDAEGLVRADAAKKAHLVDRIAYRDEIVDELKAATGRKGSKESFKQVSLANYIRAMRPQEQHQGAARVAVVYAEGDIVDGEGDTGQVGARTFAREFRKLREDPEVKAVVLRVNSPGGSATAAEQIEREISLTRQVKPVVVSMGSYAASGGYWISMASDKIYADPTTITGSIGVFGIQFDVQKLCNNLGITFDRVKTGKYADSLTIFRPKTPEEMAILQRMVDWIYGQFVDKVAAGRKLSKERVEEIAQGRVWSGMEAKKLGLVDAIGGLNAAVADAARRGGVAGNFRVEEFPARKSLADEIGEVLGKIDPSARVRLLGAIPGASGLDGQMESRLEDELSSLRSFNDPESIYARLPVGLSIR